MPPTLPSAALPAAVTLISRRTDSQIQFAHRIRYFSAFEGISDNLSIEALASEFEELPLPYRFDVKSVDGISSESLREHILRVGIPL